MVTQVLLEPIVEVAELGSLSLGGIGVEQVEAEAAEKKLLHEAGLAHLFLARRLGDFHRFLLRDDTEIFLRLDHRALLLQ